MHSVYLCMYIHVIMVFHFTCDTHNVLWCGRNLLHVYVDFAGTLLGQDPNSHVGPTHTYIYLHVHKLPHGGAGGSLWVSKS